MVALNKKTVVSYCLLNSKISLRVHNFSIRMLIIITKIRLLTLSRLEGAQCAHRLCLGVTLDLPFLLSEGLWPPSSISHNSKTPVVTGLNKYFLNQLIRLLRLFLSFELSLFLRWHSHWAGPKCNTLGYFPCNYCL